MRLIKEWWIVFICALPLWGMAQQGEAAFECEYSSWGREFWLTYLAVGEYDPLLFLAYDEHRNAYPTKQVGADNRMWVRISTMEKAAQVSIEQGGKSIAKLSIPANSSVWRDVTTQSKSLSLGKVEGGNAVHISSSVDVSVISYVGSDLSNFSESSAILPVSELGTDYLAVTSSGSYSMIGIVATEDNTQVTIQQGGHTHDNVYKYLPLGREYAEAITRATKRKGATTDLTMNRGETYFLRSYVHSLSASSIKADKKVSVFSGASMASTTGRANCLYEHVPPLNFFGNLYLVAPLGPSTGSQVQIVNTERSTTFWVYEEGKRNRRIGVSNISGVSRQLSGAAILESNKPLAVSVISTSPQRQFASMATVPPLSSRWTRRAVIRPVVGENNIPSETKFMIACLYDDREKISLNGSLLKDNANFSGFTKIRSYAYGYYQTPLNNQEHILDISPDASGFQVLVFGESDTSAYSHYAPYHAKRSSGILGTGLTREGQRYKALFCERGNLSLSVTARAGYTKYEWKKGEEKIKETGEASDGITITEEGTYYLYSDVGGQCLSIDTLEVAVFTPVAFPDSAFCGTPDHTYTFSPKRFHSYEWSDQSTGNSFTARGVGTYSLTVSSKEKCIDAPGSPAPSQRDEFKHIQVPTISLPSGQETEHILCEGEAIHLGVPSHKDYTTSWKASAHWLYLTKEHTDSIQALTEGDFEVTISNKCYSHSRTYRVNKYAASRSPLARLFDTCASEFSKQTVSSGYDSTVWYRLEKGVPDVRLYKGNTYSVSASSDARRNDDVTWDSVAYRRTLYSQCSDQHDTIRVRLWLAKPKPIFFYDSENPDQTTNLISTCRDKKIIVKGKETTRYDLSISFKEYLNPARIVDWQDTLRFSKEEYRSSFTRTELYSRANSCGTTTDTLAILETLSGFDIGYQWVGNGCDPSKVGDSLSIKATLPQTHYRIYDSTKWYSKYTGSTLTHQDITTTTEYLNQVNQVGKYFSRETEGSVHINIDSFMVYYHIVRNGNKEKRCEVLYRPPFSPISERYYFSPAKHTLPKDTTLCEAQFLTVEKKRFPFYDQSYLTIYTETPQETGGTKRSNLSFPPGGGAIEYYVDNDTFKFITLTRNRCGASRLDTMNVFTIPVPSWEKEWIYSSCFPGTRPKDSFVIEQGEITEWNEIYYALSVKIEQYNYDPAAVYGSTALGRIYIPYSNYAKHNRAGHRAYDNVDGQFIAEEIISSGSCRNNRKNNLLKQKGKRRYVHTYEVYPPLSKDTVLCPGGEYRVLPLYSEHYDVTFSKAPAAYGTVPKYKLRDLNILSDDFFPDTLYLDKLGEYEFTIRPTIKAGRNCNNFTPHTYRVTLIAPEVPRNLPDSTSICSTNDTATFYSGLRIGHKASVAWSTLGGAILSSNQDSMSTESGGRYIRRVDNGCGVFNDTTLLRVNPYSVLLERMDTICLTDPPYVYIANRGNADVKWYRNRISADSLLQEKDELPVTKSNTYIVVLTPPGMVCTSDTDTVTTLVLPHLPPLQKLASVVCIRGELKIAADTVEGSYSSFKWTTTNYGSTTPVISDTFLVEEKYLSVGVPADITVTHTNRCETVDRTVQAYRFTDRAFLGGDDTVCQGQQKTKNSLVWADSTVWYLNTIAPVQRLGRSQSFSLKETGQFIAKLYNQCNTFNDTIHFTVLPRPSADFLNRDTFLCLGDSFKLKAPTLVQKKLWTFPDGKTSTADSIYAKQGGPYSLEVTNTCTKDTGRGFFMLNLSPLPTEIGFADTTVCKNTVYTESVDLRSFNNCSWEHLRTGSTSTDHRYIFADSGIYYVSANYTLEGGQTCHRDSDTFVVAYHPDPADVNLSVDTVLCVGSGYDVVLPYDGEWKEVLWEGENEKLYIGDTLKIRGTPKGFEAPIGLYVLQLTDYCQQTTKDDTVVTHYSNRLFNEGERAITICKESKSLLLRAPPTSQVDVTYYKNSVDDPSNIVANKVQDYRATDTGTYFLVGKTRHCMDQASDTDTIHFRFHASAQLDLGNDTLICPDSTYWLVVDTSDKQFRMRWQDVRYGLDNDSFPIYMEGEYTAYRQNLICPDTAFDTVVVRQRRVPLLDRRRFPEQIKVCRDSQFVFAHDTVGLTLEWTTQNGRILSLERDGDSIIVEGTGTYYLRIENHCGTPVTDSSIIDSFPVPQITYLADTFVCPPASGFSTVLSPSVSGATKFLWKDKEGRELGNSLQLEVRARGEYRLEASNHYGCGDDSLVSRTVNVSETVVPEADLGDNVLECVKDIVRLGLERSKLPDLPDYFISWTPSVYPTSPLKDSLFVPTSGLYEAQVYHSCGVSTDNAWVSIEKPVEELKEDSVLFCHNDSVIVLAPNRSVIVFPDRDTAYVKYLKKAGSFNVSILSACGTVDKQLHVGEILPFTHFPTSPWGLCLKQEDTVTLEAPQIYYGGNTYVPNPYFTSEWNDGETGLQRIFTKPDFLYTWKLDNSCVDTILSYRKSLVFLPSILNIKDTGGCYGDAYTLNQPISKIPFTTKLNGNLIEKHPISISEKGNYELELTNRCGSRTYRFQYRKSNMKGSLKQLPSEIYRQVIIEPNDGVPPYYYAYNDLPFQKSNRFDLVPIGENWFKVRDAAGCRDSIRITVKEELFSPLSSFSPNGDGQSDYWTIKRIENYPDAEVTIYTRHGVLVATYKGSNLKWDGRFQGKLLPPDDYWYVIVFKDGTKRGGHFTLLR